MLWEGDLLEAWAELLADEPRTREPSRHRSTSTRSCLPSNSASFWRQPRLQGCAVDKVTVLGSVSCVIARCAHNSKITCTKLAAAEKFELGLQASQQRRIRTLARLC